ncbi:MAG: hydroxymethylbilane synthase, partial [Chloroflexota bacterium]|nr:hydroxymethylbilane synthase [Chloroflexota bacterium]
AIAGAEVAQRRGVHDARVWRPQGARFVGIETRTIAVGTRGSALARRQTELIMDLLRERFPGITLQMVTVQTEADRVQDLPLSQFGDKGVFVRAIERALLDGEVDLAVHSLKDVPSDVETPGLALVAFSARADPRDVLISQRGERLKDLPAGSRVGTSSLRRRVQLGAVRPDLVTVDIRGNVDTRLRKVRAGEYEAVILAAAGIDRLGLGTAITEYLPVETFLPDAGQGIMVVQGRVDDDAADLARFIDSAESRLVAHAERALVRALGAGCQSPVGALATVEGDRLLLRGMAATEDLSRLCRAEERTEFDNAEMVGQRVANRLLRSLAA